MSLHRERGPMVIDDVRALPVSPLIVAEGSTLPASVVSSGVADRSAAVWLLPSAAFQDRQLAAAGATGRLAEYFRLLREVIEREARDHDVSTLAVDGSRSASEMVAVVEQLWSERLAAGPRATTLDARRHLLRELNEAVVEQIRGYHRRPWAKGDPEVLTRTFVCECGDPACDIDVSLTVGDVTARPALAPGHGAGS